MAGTAIGDFETLASSVASGLMNKLNGDFRKRLFNEEEKTQQQPWTGEVEKAKTLQPLIVFVKLDYRGSNGRHRDVGLEK